MMTKRQRSTSPSPEVRPELWRSLAAGKPVAAIYARISPTPESEVGANYSIKSQIFEATQYCEAQGWYTDTSLHFIDDNFSGKDLDRPALDRLRDLVQSHSIDVMLAFSTDRLARRAVHLMLLNDECEKRRVRLDFVRDKFEQTPEGKLMMGIKGHLDEYEREKFRERSARGRRQQARDGFLPSTVHPPIGYRRVGRKEKCRGKWEVVEEQAATVRVIFEMCDGGASLYSIRKQLNDGGYKSAKGGLWSRTTVYQTLKHKAYTGTVMTSAGPIEVPQIIDPVLFARVQRRLAANRTERRGKPSTTYLLSKMVYCAKCRSKCYAHKSTNDRTRPGVYYHNYRCGNYDSKTLIRNCDASQVAQHTLDGIVMDAVWETLTQNLWTLVKAYHDAESKGQDKRPALERTVKTLQAKVARAEELLYNPAIKIETAQKRLLDAQTELLHAEAELKGMGVVRAMPKQQTIEALMREFREGKPETFEEWRGLLERVGVKVYYVDRSVEIEGAIPLSSPTQTTKTGPKDSVSGKSYCHSSVHRDDNKTVIIPFRVKRTIQRRKAAA